MDLNEFIQFFAEQFDDTEACDLSGGTKFKELDDWSSLVALSLIAMIDEEYDVTIKGDNIKQTKTIEELYNLVKSKL